MSAARAARRIASAAASAAAVATLALAACGSDDELGAASGTGRATAVEGTFVGRVSGSDAYIALITDGERVSGYICDGKRLSRWLGNGELEDGAAALETRDGERLGEATLTSEGARGELELDGRAHAFGAAPARGEAGLYRATIGRAGEHGSVEAGWVLLNDGSQRGAVNNVIDKNLDQAVDAAPELDPSDLQVRLGSAGVATARRQTTGIINKNSKI